MCIFGKKGGLRVRVKPGFILRKVGRQYVVAATGEASKCFNGMIRLDESGAYAFELLKNEITEQQMLAAMSARYGVPEAELEQDLAHFIAKLKEANALV